MTKTRRYSLRIEGSDELLDPGEIDERLGRLANPRGLKRDACMVAEAFSRKSGKNVEVVKHLRSGDRVEAFYSEWTIRATRAMGRPLY